MWEDVCAASVFCPRPAEGHALTVSRSSARPATFLFCFMDAEVRCEWGSTWALIFGLLKVYVG